MMDGGTIWPSVPAAQMVPVARRLSYWWASMTGQRYQAHGNHACAYDTGGGRKQCANQKW
ncbi:MAG: hypothetical protein MH213_01980 [Marinobacter sp.]|nr:hypothetical protein [Marinobacter sp.]